MPMYTCSTLRQSPIKGLPLKLSLLLAFSEFVTHKITLLMRNSRDATIATSYTKKFIELFIIIMFVIIIYLYAVCELISKNPFVILISWTSKIVLFNTFVRVGVAFIGKIDFTLIIDITDLSIIMPNIKNTNLF